MSSYPLIAKVKDMFTHSDRTTQVKNDNKTKKLHHKSARAAQGGSLKSEPPKGFFKTPVEQAPSQSGAQCRGFNFDEKKQPVRPERPMLQRRNAVDGIVPRAGSTQKVSLGSST